MLLTVVKNHWSWVKLVMPIEHPSVKMAVINSMMPVNLGKFCIPLDEGAITDSWIQLWSEMLLGNIHVLRKQVLGVFWPPPPLSSKVSICHDPPLVLRKVFLTPQPHTKKKSCRRYTWCTTFKKVKSKLSNLYTFQKRTKIFPISALGRNRREFLFKFGRLYKLFSIFFQIIMVLINWKWG